MELPQNSIGPTDLLAYRDCPRRFSYGMKRHVGIGRQDDDRKPEDFSWATDYGKAVHLLIREIEAGETPEAALAAAWNAHGARLEPADLDSLREDLETYQARDFPNTRTILNEEEIRVPLMLYRGQQIYFRTRIDRLYERIDEPGIFVHVDYKSERHPKTAKAVRENLQLWMTNWALHEYFPEIDQLEQVYDQLRFGQQNTRKTKAARARIKEWIIRETTRVIEDEHWQEDELLKPAKNDWCSWCPLLESCSIVPDLSDWARVKIGALAPTVKEGRKTVLALEPDRLEEYVARFTDAKAATRILKRFEESLSELLKDLPAEKRGELGYALQPRRGRSYNPQAVERLHEILGDRFYEVVTVTKQGLKSELAGERELLSLALELAEESVSEALVAAK